ncbi:MAG: hypothetical protein M0031_01090 [Thermaerobacter sp.]|jgi:hypothetical protein|nr:hypothetical protein [Thermaerobacter sp.]
MAVVAAPEREMVLRALADTVRAVEPQVRDVVLIGSAVYAPDLARDYDLVVTTRTADADDALFDRLLDATNAAADKAVDVIVRRPGGKIGNLAGAILAGRVLLGGMETIAEARVFFEEGGGAMNSFEQADAALINAEDTFELARTTDKPAVKDRRYRNAFNELFDAARIAALTYLGREDTHWSGIARELPWPHGKDFREMIGTLHVSYSYDGNYPKDELHAAQEFQRWKDRVEELVVEMRRRTLNRTEDMPER